MLSLEQALLQSAMTNDTRELSEFETSTERDYGPEMTDYANNSVDYANPFNVVAVRVTFIFLYVFVFACCFLGKSACLQRSKERD